MGNHYILGSLLVTGPIQTARVPNQYWSFLGIANPAGNSLLKFNNRNTRTRCEVCSKLRASKCRLRSRAKKIYFRSTAIRKRGVKHRKYITTSQMDIFSVLFLFFCCCFFQAYSYKPTRE